MKHFLLFLLLVVFSFSGCSPLYVTQAALEQITILYNREDITDVLEDKNTSEEVKEKLRYILKAKEFSESIGLDKNDSYTKYTEIKRPELSWIVMGSEKTAFKIKTWWFPVVGTVPYKGFFDESDAREYALNLETDENLETWVRPTDAYSTLGWFNDPVVSPLLKRTIPELVETVIHEQFHSTIWFPDNVELNETVANVVGLLGAVEFFQIKENDPESQYYLKAVENLNRAIKIEKFINSLFDSLQKIYQDSNLSEEQKLSTRNSAYSETIKQFIKDKNTLEKWATPNNARIMQIKTYYTGFNNILQQSIESSNQKNEYSLKKLLEILGQRFATCKDKANECSFY
jgi:predicted aminopeptidase